MVIRDLLTVSGSHAILTLDKPPGVFGAGFFVPIERPPGTPAWAGVISFSVCMWVSAAPFVPRPPTRQ